MDWDIFWGSLIIFLARVADVSLITLRSAAVVQGRRVSAWCYAFLGMLIWILVVTDVIKNLERPAYILAFALGFATGTTVGMYLENWFAVGRRVIRVFSKRGDEVADGLSPIEKKIQAVYKFYDDRDAEHDKEASTFLELKKAGKIPDGVSWQDVDARKRTKWTGSVENGKIKKPTEAELREIFA